MKRRLLPVFLAMSFSLCHLAFAEGPAARIGDTTSHGGTILPPGASTVFIGGMSAARITDLAICPLVTPPNIPHGTGPIVTGSNTVFIEGLGAARVGDTVAEPGGPPSIIATGETTVIIGD